MFLVLFFLGAFLAPQVVGQTTPDGKPEIVTIIPQAAVGQEAGGQDQVTFVFKNLSSTDWNRVGVDWYDGNSQPINLLLKLGNGNSAIAGGLQASLPPGWNGGEVDVLSSPDGKFKTSWLRFWGPTDSFGKPQTSVSVAFQRVMPDGSVAPISYDLVPVMAAPRAAFYGNSSNTGVAICNPGDTTTTVTITRKDGEGVTVSLSIPPDGQVACFLGELLGEFVRTDLVEIVSDFPVAVMPLEMVVDPTDGRIKYQSFPVAVATVNK
jgi:hypothetical protein